MLAWRSFPEEPGAAPGAYLTMPALRSAGIVVAFTTRLGGAAAGDGASLNLSLVAGDDPDRVRANRRRVTGALGLPPDAWTSGAQVHEAGVAEVTAGLRGRGSAEHADTLPGIDALWTAEPGTAVAVLAADCVPVLLADPERRRVAAIHAGWRGMVAGVVREAANAIGPSPSLWAVVGPSIGPCCYEVGDDVAEEARAALGDAVVVPRTPRPHLDLWLAAAGELRRAGVTRILPSALCTRCEPHRFFSHRAGATGRHGLVAGLL